MPRAPAHSLAKLPHLLETWQIAIAQLRIWITPPDQAPYRPYVILILSLKRGAVRAVKITPSQPGPGDVRDLLFEAMRRPAPGSGAKGIPHTVLVPDSSLADALVPSLAETQCTIDVFEQTLSAQVSQMIQNLEEHVRDGPEPPTMLSVEGATPELVGAFFAAASAFYRAAPWVYLNNDQVLALRHPAESNYRYTVVMGQAGIQYGLATYLSWEDWEQLYANGERPTATIPAHGVHSLFYEAINWMPFGDVEALQQFGWEVAGENAYPIAMVFQRDGQVRRPAPIALRWYEAALRAIPILVRDYLQPDGHGDYQPLETEIEVATHTGPVRMVARYPARQTPLAEQPVQRTPWSGFEEEGGGAMLPVFDRRAMEGTMQEIAQQMGAEIGSGDPDLDRAQALMYQAFEETKPAKRIALAHDALAISPNCADAYVLLAEEEAPTVSRALELYRQGVAAGERALGAAFFKENAGHFWGVLETRPYMRARRGLADALWHVGQKDEALAHYRELLRLNPGDNQGNRYLLANLLLQMDRIKEIVQLLAQYRDEWTATWLYTRALVRFRQQGASKQAEKTLRDALNQNPHVPAYLTGRKRIPVHLPEYIGWGDEHEAIAYAADHLNYWRRTPGAVEWLSKHVPVKRSK